MKLGGIVCIRNGDELGYCWRECIQSLLPVCDVVAVSDGESLDGTQELLRAWADHEPKLVLNVYPWPNPKGNPSWYADWIQYARMHAPADYVFHLDADEVLHEESYEEVLRLALRPSSDRFSVVCRRFNFWRDNWHLIPEGHCCGHEVIRMAPQNLFLASDGYDPRGEEVPQLAQASGIKIMHYGFIRPWDKFFSKARNLQRLYFDQYDPRLEKAEALKENWASMPGVTGWEDQLTDYEGTHPKVMHDWLRKNGYDCERTHPIDPEVAPLPPGGGSHLHLDRAPDPGLSGGTGQPEPDRS